MPRWSRCVEEKRTKSSDQVEREVWSQDCQHPSTETLLGGGFMGQSHSKWRLRAANLAAWTTGWGRGDLTGQ